MTDLEINDMWESVTISSNSALDEIGVRLIGYDVFKAIVTNIHDKANIQGRREQLVECSAEIFNVLK